MNPMITSLAGLAAVLTCACALLLMLELRGNPSEDKETNQRLIRAHRIAGWLTAILVLAVSAVMLVKTGIYHDEFPPRALLHSALGILLIPLFAVKILLVRRFKRLGTMVPGFGLAVFFVLFLLYGLTGGYYFLHKSAGGCIVLSGRDNAGLLDDADLGRRIVAEKCVKCHSLERIFRAIKSEQGWTKTVSRMAAIDAPNIRDFDAKQIIHYLIIQQQRREEKLAAEPQNVSREIGRSLINQKCTLCHSLDRVYTAEKSQAEWTETVGRMMSHADDSDFLSQEEKEAVISFLSEREDKTEPQPRQKD